MWWLYVFLFVLGLQLGSFINAFNHRLWARQSICRGRSRCPHCQHELGWLDLFPVFSFLFLKGRCRYCRKPIGWHYPVVEFLAGCLLVLIGMFSTWPWAVFYSLVFLILLAVSAYDWHHFLIPDRLLLVVLVTSVLFLAGQGYVEGNWLTEGEPSLLSGLVAGSVGFLFFYALHALTRGRGMGFGDVKLAFILGMIVGWPGIILSVFLSFVIGAIISLLLIGIGWKKMKDVVPFGPFLVLGALITVLWGQAIINWYLGFIWK